MIDVEACLSKKPRRRERSPLHVLPLASKGVPPWSHSTTALARQSRGEPLLRSEHVELPHALHELGTLRLKRGDTLPKGVHTTFDNPIRLRSPECVPCKFAIGVEVMATICDRILCSKSGGEQPVLLGETCHANSSMPARG